MNASGKHCYAPCCCLGLSIFGGENERMYVLRTIRRGQRCGGWDSDSRITDADLQDIRDQNKNNIRCKSGRMYFRSLRYYEKERKILA